MQNFTHVFSKVVIYNGSHDKGSTLYKFAPPVAFQSINQSRILYWIKNTIPEYNVNHCISIKMILMILLQYKLNLYFDSFKYGLARNKLFEASLLI